jgi:hypothetical protein
MIVSRWMCEARAGIQRKAQARLIRPGLVQRRTLAYGDRTKAHIGVA